MKNSADQGECYPQRPKAEVDNTLRDLQKSSYPTKAEFNNCFIIIHQTHYEKSDWSRAFNQFTIACELDMINVFIMGYVTFSLGCYMVCCSVTSLAVGYIYLSCSHLYSFASYDRPYALKIKYPVIRGFFYT